jgi:hypothetical protein
MSSRFLPDRFLPGRAQGPQAAKFCKFFLTFAISLLQLNKYLGEKSKKTNWRKK